MPTVDLTVLQVSHGDPRETVAVARLSYGGKSRTSVRPGGRGKRGSSALVKAAADALADLKRPCLVRVTCNDKWALGLMRKPADGSAFAAAAARHRLQLQHARGDAMGDLGRQAYAAGQRRIAAASEERRHVADAVLEPQHQA